MSDLPLDAYKFQVNLIFTNKEALEEFHDWWNRIEGYSRYADWIQKIHPPVGLPDDDELRSNSKEWYTQYDKIMHEWDTKWFPEVRVQGIQQ